MIKCHRLLECLRKTGGAKPFGDVYITFEAPITCGTWTATKNSSRLGSLSMGVRMDIRASAFTWKFAEISDRARFAESSKRLSVSTDGQ
jgi:hypothetical protein